MDDTRPLASLTQEELSELVQGLSTPEATEIIKTLPEPIRSWLRQLARLRGSPQLKAEVERLGSRLQRAHPQLTPKLPGALAPVLQEKLSQLRQVYPVVDGLLGDIDALDEALGDLWQAAEEAFPEDGRATVEQALERVREHLRSANLRGLFGDTKSTVGNLESFIHQLASGADLSEVARLQQRLDKQLAQLQLAATNIDPAAWAQDLAVLLQEWTLLAEKHGLVGSQVAVRLLYALASELQQTVDDPEHPERVEPLWEDTFALAEREAALRPATMAARRLQMAALERTDRKRVAELAHRLAAIGDAVGDVETRVGSRLEEGLYLALEGQHTAAEAAVRQAVELALASEDEELKDRAMLALGQVLDEKGDAVEARQCYQSVLENTQQHLATLEHRGHALFGMASCAIHEGDEAESLDYLERCLKAAADAGDVELYSKASLAALDLHVNADRRQRAVTLLVRARNTLTKAIGQSGADFFEEVASRLEQTWGKEAFEHELLAFRARFRSGEPLD